MAWDPDGVLASAPPVPAFTGSLIERKLRERAARLAQQQQNGTVSLSSELTSTQQVCGACLLKKYPGQQSNGSAHLFSSYRQVSVAFEELFEVSTGQVDTQTEQLCVQPVVCSYDQKRC